MQKQKNVIGLLAVAVLICASQAFATSFRNFAPEAILLKAGPTEPNEELSIPWVETALYPKNIEAGNPLFIEVGSASKVKEVKAELDQAGEFQLFSGNQNDWNLVIDSTAAMKKGLHFLKIKIIAESGKQITRTLAFRVIDINSSKWPDYSFPLLIKEDSRLSRGKTVKAGEKLEALYKQTYYWVKGANGEEGWVEASKVEEPKREIYAAAYQAFVSGDFDRAVAYYNKVVEIDPGDADANYWLAKSYDKLGEESMAVKHIASALAADPAHIGANWMAGRLAGAAFSKGEALVRMGNYKDALEAYEQAVVLRPSSVSYLFRLGSAYNNAGDNIAAEDTWKRILLVDPDNTAVHTVLRTNYYKLMSGDEDIIVKKDDQKTPEPKTEADLDRLAQRYVKAVKQGRTDKGTLISLAIRSVVSMTRSLGTKIHEEGWKTDLSPSGFLVSYVCRQERMGKLEPELFTFKVDLDTNKIEPKNNNAALLMHRW